jgi:hypothetical protein
MQRLLAAALILFAAFPANAGTYSVDGKGQLSWKPDRCDPPTPPPPSLLEAHPETRAGDMNQRAMQYNTYVELAQAYMNCVSAEADQDAAAAGQAVVNSGQSIIEKMQKDLKKMSANVKKQSD